MKPKRNRASRIFLLLPVVGGCLWCFPRRGMAETIWVHASQARSLSGPIAFGRKVGIVEEGALGDFLVSTVCVTDEALTGGCAEYRIQIPKAAPYTIWARLRYPLGLDASFAFIPGGEEPTADPGRLLGNSGVGVRQWHWDSQGDGPGCKPGTGKLRLTLAAGDFTFRIYAREANDTVFGPGGWRMARPMFNPRLNVICLTTDPDYVPTDADAGRALSLSPARVDEETVKAKPPPLPPVSQEEMDGLGKKGIPDWLRCPRFYTKDAWRDELAYRHPGDIAFMVRQIAANEGSAFRLAAYWGGDAYFQSGVAPHAPGLGKLDYLREAVDEGRRSGVKVVMYMNPNCLYEGHPLFEEAVVREADGSPRKGPSYGIRDAHFACINNPKYRDFLAAVLTEAFTRYDLAGLYVDGLTPHRCFCGHCRNKYRKMWDAAMPVEKLARGGRWTVLWEMVSQPEPVGDPGDPDARRYTRFLHQSLVEATRLVSTTVKRCKPDAVTMYHSWPKPESMAYYDGTLTEIYVRHPWEHRLWKFGELANYSNIFPVPVLFNIYLHDHGTEAEARTKMIQGLAGGCYPNCWNLLSMRPIFRFVRENAECFDFARTRPTKFLALPRTVRHDSAQRQLISQQDPTAKPPRDRFLAPYVGLYSALVRRGLPIVTLQRSDFHVRLDGFKVLCLANEACLSDEQVEAVRRFVAAGGGLIATHETSLYDEKARRRDDFGLADVFGVHYRGILPASVRQIHCGAAHPATEGLDTSEPLIHDEPHVVAQLSSGDSLARLAGDDVKGESVPAIVVHEYGSGRVVYLPGRLESIQCARPTPAIERLVANAVRWVAGEAVPVQVDAPLPIGVTLFDQPDRRILHLVSLNGDTRYGHDKIEPIHDIEVELQIPEGLRVTKLRRLWAKGDVPFRSDGNRLRFRLPVIGEYEVVAAELKGR